MNALMNLTPPQAAPGPDLQKASLIGLSLDELRALAKEMEEPAFRADQLHHWLYVKCVRDFERMTNLRKSFRDKLAERFQVGCLSIAQRQVSRDGTVKYLLRLPDGQVVESVLMHFEDRNMYTVCISTQVGCAVNCDFCATGKLGFKRNLSVAEIVDQYVLVQADSGKEVRNIVFMGQGEPLLNYDALMASIRILNRSAEVGMRHITVSTSGIVPRIDDLAAEDLQLTLAVSLHAPDNDTRSAIMPLNRKWPLETLMPALRRYVTTTGKRLTIEYVLLSGVNDQASHAHALGRLLQGLKCNINLIPYNPIGNAYGYQRPSTSVIRRFKEIAGSYGKKVTVRMERGVDIAAACGQLANKDRLAKP